MEHTPDGGIITVHFDENPMYSEITVADNGSGIEKEDLPYIFRRFYKGKKGNFGLGLAISKNVIERHNGTIAALNTETGALFKIRLPVKKGGSHVQNTGR
jgi:signal transduction histidine kinase